MELILINDKKLKIMLTPEDMKEYELDCETVDYTQTETRRAFWNILDEAKHQTGFDAASERVYIQLYPSRTGGCEMYVTKVGLLPTGVRSTQKGMLRIAQERKLAYSFSDMDGLLRVCRQLDGVDCIGGSRAYIDDSGICYLYISGVRGFGIPERLSFVSEFGTSEDPERLSGYIGEHCRCICESDAIKTLSALA